MNEPIIQARSSSDMFWTSAIQLVNTSNWMTIANSEDTKLTASHSGASAHNNAILIA